jgi:hypothetical protein
MRFQHVGSHYGYRIVPRYLIPGPKVFCNNLLHDCVDFPRGADNAHNLDTIAAGAIKNHISLKQQAADSVLQFVPWGTQFWMKGQQLTHLLELIDETAG